MTDTARCPDCGLDKACCKDSCSGKSLQLCPHGLPVIARCEECHRFPFIDLTTAGANVSPVKLFADPRYVAQPDMPAGEPDYHDLVSIVGTVQREQNTMNSVLGMHSDSYAELRRQCDAQRIAVDGLSKQFAFMHRELAEHFRTLNAKIERVASLAASDADLSNLFTKLNERVDALEAGKRTPDGA